MMDYNLPKIRTVSDCERMFPDILIISHYNTYEKFDDLYFMVYKCCCAAYEIPECISYKIRFKFYISDQKVYELSMPKFLLNINTWRPLIELNSLQKYYHDKIEVLDESFIVNQMMSDTLRVALESRILSILNEYGVAFDRSSDLIKTVLERFQEVSIEFSLVSKGSIFTYENCFLNDYMNSEKIRELNNIEISQELQTADVEILLNEKHKELIEELGTTKNPIWYVSKAGNHIKSKQVQELFISYGQIPDVTGNIIPYTMEGNGFRTGYNSPSSYYVAATGARLAAIMNISEMGSAGYLSRNLVLLSRTLTLSNTTYDCGTKHLLPIYVRDSSMLRRLENKWFCEYQGDQLQYIHYPIHKHLIGKTIYIRSLVTCAGGDEACHLCYGRDSHLVANMPGMAVFNTEVYSSTVEQNVLSTKHLLFTAANRLTLSESFNKYFKYTTGDIYLKEPDEWNDQLPIEYLSIRIEEDNFTPLNNNDINEHSAFGNNIESPIYVYNKKTNEYDSIEILNYEAMFMDASTVKMFKLITDKKKDGRKFYDIPLSTLSSELEGRLLSIDIKNNGLTDILHRIMSFLQKDGAKFDNYGELSQYFFEMLIDAGIQCRIVQSEIILNRLLRDANDLYSRPDFSKFKHPECKILTLNKALMNTKAPTVSLSYQEFKKQLLSDDLYDIKDGSSYLDPLYATKIKTDNLRKYRERINKNISNGEI